MYEDGKDVPQDNRYQRKLAFSEAEQIPLHSGVETPPELKRIETLKAMTVNYAKVGAKMQEIRLN